MIARSDHEGVMSGRENVLDGFHGRSGAQEGRASGVTRAGVCSGRDRPLGSGAIVGRAPEVEVGHVSRGLEAES